MNRFVAARAACVACAVMLSIAGSAIILPPSSHALAQDDASTDLLFQMTLDEGSLPVSPAFVRLLRITMEAGSNTPLHTHPGPELWRIESGTVTLFIQGPSLLARAADPSKVEQAPQNSEIELNKGDQIGMLPGTAMTFSNKASDQTKILVAVVLPAGNQRPPGITYLGTQPNEDAFKGITSDILGDGVATTLPGGQAQLTIERLKVSSGQPIPSEPGPVLLSVAKGALEFTVVKGSAQVSRTAEPGPQPDAAAGTTFSIGKGDAIFFPAGMVEAARTSAMADVTFYKMTISGSDAGGSDGATPVAGEPGEIQITGPAAPAATATPVATKAPATTPTAAPSPSPTATTGASGIEPGATVYINDDDVRLRSAATTDSDIVTGLTRGEEMVVTGPSEQGNDITWWPVQDVTDPTIAGYVAEQFLSTEPPA